MAGKGQAEGCASCAKWCLIVFNVLFCLIGLGLIVAGVFAYVTLRDYLNLVGNPLINAPAIVLIAFGCITFIIAAIGCIGACKESSGLLFLFAVIIGILLVAEIIAGGVAIAYRGKIEMWFDEHSHKLMTQYNATGEDNVAKDTWDKVQKELDCCGVNGTSDWMKDPTSTIPASCGTKAEAPNKKGCKQGVLDLIEKNIYLVGGVGIAFGLIELLGIVLACCVGCNARKGQMA